MTMPYLTSQRETLLSTSIVFVGGLSCWQGLSALAVIPEYLAPAPTVVFVEFVGIGVSGELFYHARSTFLRWAPGFVLGAIAGILLGFIGGLSRTFRATLEFPVEFLRATPVTALLPLFLVAFGSGDLCKVMMILLPTLLLIYMNTYYGVLHADQGRVIMARSFGASQWKVFSRVLIYEALPGIFVGLRLALSLSLVVAVLVEMFVGADSGLGQRVYESYLMNGMPTLYAYIIATGCFGFLVSAFLRRVEVRCLFWVGK